MKKVVYNSMEFPAH